MFGATLSTADATTIQRQSLGRFRNERPLCSEIVNALARDGKVQMPPGPTFFAKRFGGVIDKFGVNWMVLVPQPHQ
jgi:uncharacterized glyoxalase superfamily protein PhnB